MSKGSHHIHLCLTPPAPPHSSEESQCWTIGPSHSKAVVLCLSPRDVAVSKDVPRITATENLSSNSESRLITAGWKVIGSSSQRRAPRTSSPQALSGFISLSSPLSQPGMTLSRRERRPLRDGVELTVKYWAHEYHPIDHLLVSSRVVLPDLNCHNDRGGDKYCLQWRSPSVLYTSTREHQLPNFNRFQNSEAAMATSRSTVLDFGSSWKSKVECWQNSNCFWWVSWLCVQVGWTSFNGPIIQNGITRNKTKTLE